MDDLERIIHTMQERVAKIKAELEEMGEPKAMPELIDSANLIRANVHLIKSNQKKSELIDLYEEYLEQLKVLSATVSEIRKKIPKL